MAAPASAYKDRQFLAVIGDEVRSLSHSSYTANLGQDTVTGMLLAGVGVSSSPAPGTSSFKTND